MRGKGGGSSFYERASHTYILNYVRLEYCILNIDSFVNSFVPQLTNLEWWNHNIQTHTHTHIYMGWVQITFDVILSNVTPPNNLLLN